MWLADKAPNTVRYYTAVARRFQGQLAKPLREVTRADIGRIFSAKALSSQTHTDNARNIPVRSLLRFLHDEGFITKSLFSHVPLQPHVDDLQRSYERNTPEEVASLLDHAADDPRLSALLVLLARFGLTRGEVIALDTSDIAEDGRRLFVPGRFERSLRVPKPLATILWNYAGEMQWNGPLFPSRLDGEEKRLSARQIHRLVAVAGDELGIVVRPSSLRNCFIHACIVSNMSNGRMQAQFGHPSLKHIARWLIHYSAANPSTTTKTENAARI